MSSIFVHLTSYRNFDVIPTIRDCIERSSDKENLHFGVCLQQDEEVPPEIIHPRIKVHKVPYKESLGPGWARHIAQSFYDGQDYQLQVDSGSRFAEKWDEKLIQAMSQSGSPNPLITNFPNKFNASANQMELPELAYKTHVYQMLFNVPSTWPTPMKGVNSLLPSNWVNQNFFFSKGSYCSEVKADPELYFSELESALTVRSYCAGYDLFSHFVPVVWRNYDSRPMNWLDDAGWWLKDMASKRRLSDLLSGNVPLGYGISGPRSLKDFEIYSGIDLKERLLQRSVVSGENPPYKYENEEKWNEGYMKDHMITVSWDTNEIEKCEDYDYWYFAVEDDKENVINRQDLRIERDAPLLEFKSNFKKIFFKSIKNQVPKRICIQPVSKSKGWLRKVKFDI